MKEQEAQRHRSSSKVINNVSDMSEGVLNPEAVAERGRRYDPFSDAVLSVDEIMRREIEGKERFAETQRTEVVRQLVQDALSKMDFTERSVLIDVALAGRSVNDVALDLGVNSVQAEKILTQAKSSFIALVQSDRQRIGLLPVYHKCPICNHPDVAVVDGFIINWLKSRDWKYFGLASALKKNYGIEVLRMLDIQNHVQFHIPDYDDAMDKIQSHILAAGSKFLNNPKHELAFTISEESNSLLDEICVQYGRSRSDVARHALHLGLKSLKSILAMNEDFFEASIMVASVYRKVRKL